MMEVSDNLECGRPGASPPTQDDCPLMTGLGQKQIDQFHEDGYLQLDGLLPVDELNPVIWEFEGVIDREARGLKAQGNLTDLHEREPFDRRIALLAAQVPGIAHYLSPHRVLGPAMFNLMRNEKLLDALESLLGPEILCHPTHVVRPRMRDRPKGEERWRPTDGVPWHQDAGVLRPEVDETLLITAWIPLTRAARENGCLMVIPGSHRYGVRLHEAATNYGIPEAEVPPGRAQSVAHRAGRRDPVQQPGLPQRPAERFGSCSLEHRPALPGPRPADRPSVFQRARCPQPPESRQSTDLSRMGHHVGEAARSRRALAADSPLARVALPLTKDVCRR